MSFVYFVSIAVSGPVFGVIVGGYVFNALGGYNDPKSFPLAVFMSLISFSVSFPMTYADEVWVLNTLLWVQFFSGGFIVPVLTGIMLNTVPPSLRTLANSMANLCYNLLGYLPAPFVYGIAYEMTGGQDE